MENVNEILFHIKEFGLIYLFVIIMLEHMNFPGLPAGVIMPAAGILASSAGYNLIFVIVISILAGLLGSIALYWLGYWLGEPMMKWIYKKFKSTRNVIDKGTHYVEKYEEMGMLYGRLIPVARTIVSFIAGVFRVNFLDTIIPSIIGISIWNGVLILAGYLGANLFEWSKVLQ